MSESMSLFKDLTQSIYFSRPPLVFQGNKKNFLKPFLKVLHSYTITPNTIFVDVFGGSGFLSHHIKSNYPQNRVIYNDFDDFATRLKIAPVTEKIRAKLCEIVGDNKDKQKRLSNEAREAIVSYLQSLDEKDIDCIQLSSYLCFSGNYYKDLKKLIPNIKYDHLSRSPIVTTGYLAGVERVQKDYKELLDEFKDDENAFFVFDPPYLQTNTDAYTQHFRLKSFLGLNKFFTTHKNCIFFSSTRSDCAEFFEWYQRELNFNAHIKTFKTSTNDAKDTDILFYK